VLILDAEVEGRPGQGVRLEAGRVTEIAPGLARRSGEAVLDARGGALLPGLHDHHIHLFALAAARGSVACGPPAVTNARELATALSTAPVFGNLWIRGFGYHESVAGELDRAGLDRWQPERPLRMQHRTGALWIVNSAGVAALGLDAGSDAAGVERDGAGRATGRLFDLDPWLRERWRDSDFPSPVAFPSLAALGRELASCGVTGVTDATASNGRAEATALADAVREGVLPVRVIAMGTPELASPDGAELATGAVKIMLAERNLPELSELCRRIRAAHAIDRAVAIHCATRTELIFAAAALGEAGARAGDRIEHASVAPPECISLLSALPVTVVTQPGFIHDRGDVYATEVAPEDRPWLYRGRGFLDAGIPLGAGTDAPYGDVDPWGAIRAAIDRRSAGGLVLGYVERLTPEAALALFTTAPNAPGGAPRRVAVGRDADLCLLDRRWVQARRSPSRAFVAATLVGGRITYCCDRLRGSGG
jgi:predicted amidohydrolase YtcJ